MNSIDIIKIIKTDRLELRLKEFNLDLARQMHNCIQLSLAELKPYLEWSFKINTLEEVIEYLVSLKSQTSLEDMISYGIFLEGAYIGQITLKCKDFTAKKYELTYWISTDYTGQGYMTEAVISLEAVAFEDCKVNKIEIVADTGNIASNKVIQKLGYTLEGVLKEDKFSQYYQTYRDVNTYAKLAKDYRN
jgi:RimJ/RimL family protein N-acetyltransferase